MARKRSSTRTVSSSERAVIQSSRPTEGSGFPDHDLDTNTETSAQRIDDLAEDIANLITGRTG